MSQTVATVAQKLEKGYMKMVRFDSDKILYVSGKQRDVGSTFEFSCDTPDGLASAANGGKNHFLKLDEVTRFRTRSDSKTIDIGFKDAKGRSCTIDIDVRDKNQKEAIFAEMGRRLGESGFQASQKEASALAVSWGPVLLMLVTFVIDGLLTAVQATGNELEMEEDFGGGRTARKGRGIAALVVLATNLLGFWGCLIITVLVLLISLAYLLRRLKNRPVISIWSPV